MKTLGVGLSFTNDKIGPTQSTGIFADFAYKIQIGEKGKLAFGLKGGLNVRGNKLSELTTDQSGDSEFQQNVQSQLLPNFGFGVYYSQPQFYVGLSTPRLLENDFDENTTAGSTNLASWKRHYFLYSWYNF